MVRIDVNVHNLTPPEVEFRSVAPISWITLGASAVFLPHEPDEALALLDAITDAVAVARVHHLHRRDSEGVALVLVGEVDTDAES